LFIGALQTKFNSIEYIFLQRIYVHIPISCLVYIPRSIEVLTKHCANQPCRTIVVLVWLDRQGAVAVDLWDWCMQWFSFDGSISARLPFISCRRHLTTFESSSGTRGRCYDHIFLRFSTIFCEKIMIKILHNLALLWVKNANFVADFIGENILKITKSVPVVIVKKTPTMQCPPKLSHMQRFCQIFGEKMAVTLKTYVIIIIVCLRVVIWVKNAIFVRFFLRKIKKILTLTPAALKNCN
jgi:hypothetical protein